MLKVAIFSKHLTTKSFDSYEEMDNKCLPNLLEIPKHSIKEGEFNSILQS